MDINLTIILSVFIPIFAIAFIGTAGSLCLCICILKYKACELCIDDFCYDLCSGDTRRFIYKTSYKLYNVARYFDKIITYVFSNFCNSIHVIPIRIPRVMPPIANHPIDIEMIEIDTNHIINEILDSNRLPEIDIINRIEPIDNKCCVCLDNTKCILFIPCNHVCCCQTCSDYTINCPICREIIQEKKKVFL